MCERIRISVQPVDAETGSHIWAEKFDRGLEEIFAVQDRVVQTIVSTLVGRVQVAGAAECLSMKADFSTAQFVKREPFKIPADAEQLAASLRLAGLPD